MSDKAFFVLLTNQCNLSCKHCYNELDPIKAKGRIQGKDILTVDRLSYVFSKFSEQGYTKVLFSGGEALLRPDLSEIISKAKNHGLKTALFTNGHLLSKNTVKQLGNAKLDEIRISFNEMVWCKTRENYERIFANQTQWVSLLKQNGISVGFVFIVSGYNIDYVIEIYDRLQSLGASMKIQPLYVPDTFKDFSKVSASCISQSKWENLFHSFGNRIQQQDASKSNAAVYGLSDEITNYIKFLSYTYTSGKRPGFCPTGPLLVIDAEGYFHPCLFRHDIVCGHISKDEDIKLASAELDKYKYFSRAKCYKEECLSAFR